MNRVLLGAMFAGVMFAGVLFASQLTLRNREGNTERQFDFPHTALVICDMWDHHWCKGAEDRVEILAAKMVPVIDRLRARGVLIIHAPSETMAFYQDHPARLAMLKIPQVEPPHELDRTAPPLPIDDSDGGCGTNNNKQK